MKERIKRFGRAVRNVWLMAGMTLLLFCVLEVGLSVVFAVKDRFRESRPSAVDRRAKSDAYPDTLWADTYYEEFNRSLGAQWRPYVYWRRKPYSGAHINVDSNGIRQTVTSIPPRLGPFAPVKIFMFGGSAMWGTGARDAFTIPSILAKELQDNGLSSEVVNFGETGYVSTQETIALMLQLQKRQIPDLVIFYDGVNDAYSAYQHRIPGLPQNEFNRVNEFNLSKPERSRDMAGIVLRDMTMRLSTVRFLNDVLRKAGIRQRQPEGRLGAFPIGDMPSDSPALAEAVVDTYRGNIDVVRALGKHYGFKCIFYWQPTIFGKASLSKYERKQRARMMDVEPLVRQAREAIRESGLADGRECVFRDLGFVFADVAEPRFLDWCHLGESGNEAIAKEMAIDVLDLLAANGQLAADEVSAP